MDVAHRGCRLLLLGVFTLFSLTLSATALAAGKPDRTSWGQNISVGSNEEVGELTCFGCSIRVRGQVTGDVTAFFGSIVVEDQGQVGGDVTAFGANVRLDQALKVNGDVTVFGGEIRRNPQASVKGDVTTMGGRAWILPIFLTPFVVAGLLIAFVVWLVRRVRRASLSAAPA